ncbi:mCG148017 [Mus musculus]|nr:mCG148017 [Mus musculus]
MTITEIKYTVDKTGYSESNDLTKIKVLLHPGQLQRSHFQRLQYLLSQTYAPTGPLPSDISSDGSTGPRQQGQPTSPILPGSPETPLPQCQHEAARYHNDLIPTSSSPLSNFSFF